MVSRKGQSRLASWIEASVNTASGALISFMVGLLVYPLLGWKSTVGQTAAAVLIFTLVSIVRSYVWRRVFNNIYIRTN